MLLKKEKRENKIVSKPIIISLDYNNFLFIVQGEGDRKKVGERKVLERKTARRKIFRGAGFWRHYRTVSYNLVVLSQSNKKTLCLGLKNVFCALQYLQTQLKVINTLRIVI